MKKLLALLALLTGMAASAASVTVTIPSTTLSDASTVVGSFTYDTVSSAVSNISITAAPNVRAGAYTVLGGNVSPGSFFYVRKTGAIGSELNTDVILIQYSGAGIPAGGGATTLTSLTIGQCTGVVGGACTNWSTTGFVNNFSVTVSAPPPAPVPTLSEWALISFAMLIVGFGVYQQRRRQL
jgi:hypothetical protein